MAVTWSPGLLGTLYLIWSVTWRLPGPWWLVSIATFVPFLPVLETVTQINAKEPIFEGPNSSFSGNNVVLILFGGLMVFLAIMGTFVDS